LYFARNSCLQIQPIIYVMNIQVYLERLRAGAITEDQISTKTDQEILKIRGIGRQGLGVLREKYGWVPNPSSPLDEQITHAISPVLLRRTGRKTIARLAAMVAAYFEG